MKETFEREVKLEPGPGFVMPELGGTRLPSRSFVSTYHDTEDLALARHGLTLRHRLEDGAGAWQLKLPQDGDRLELEQPGTAGRPPGELIALLFAFLRGRELEPVARLRTRRDVVLVDGAEVADDAVAVLTGQRVTGRFRELEVELTGGDERTLRRLAKALRAAGAERGDSRPKVYRALDLPSPARPAVVPKGAPAGVALGAALAEQARRIVVNDPGTRLGSDPEHLHRMRVATRRLRAFLRAGRPLLDRDWAEQLRAELGWLGRSLGPARDLDVLVDHLAAELEAVGGGATGLLDDLRRERAEARREAVSALSGDRYLAVLDRLDGVGEPPLSGRTVRFVSLWRAEWKRARAPLAAIGDDAPDEALHDARILLKRARYVAELGRHELGGAGERFADAASRLQDVLGEHQDAAVAEARITAWAESSGVPAQADELVRRQRERRRAARVALPAAWRDVRRAAKPLT